MLEKMYRMKGFERVDRVLCGAMGRCRSFLSAIANRSTAGRVDTLARACKAFGYKLVAVPEGVQVKYGIRIE